MEVYGAYETFDSALDVFKKLVKEAREEFVSLMPIDIDDEQIENIQCADLFENFESSCDYKSDDSFFDDEEEDNFLEDSSAGNRIKWFCDIGESSACWEMTSKSSDPTDVANQTIALSLYA